MLYICLKDLLDEPIPYISSEILTPEPFVYRITTVQNERQLEKLRTVEYYCRVRGGGVYNILYEIYHIKYFNKKKYFEK